MSMRVTRGAFSLAILCTLLVTACGKPATTASGTGKPGGPGAMPAPVRVVQAESKTVPILLNAVGAVEAYSTVVVKSQVNGVLLSAGFKEGDLVRKDQVLFNIDPRPYEAALKEAEANLSKALAQAEQARAGARRTEAQADNANKEYDRDKVLVERGTISQQEFDVSQTAQKSAQAAAQADVAAAKSADEAVRSARAAVDEARLQLDYCTIRAPMDGRSGSLLVHPGNLAKANDTQGLVTVTQIEPIYVTFTVPESSLSELRKRFSEGTVTVDALLRGEEDKPVAGALAFIDNQVGTATGTIRMKATYPNQDGRLWPGQFVSVRIGLSQRADAVVVPSRAVSPDQNGEHVFVVTADMKAELRPVVVDFEFGDEVVIASGLAAGETVVVDGQVRVVPGGALRILDDKEATAPETSGGASAS